MSLPEDLPEDLPEGYPEESADPEEEPGGDPLLLATFLALPGAVRLDDASHGVHQRLGVRCADAVALRALRLPPPGAVTAGAVALLLDRGRTAPALRPRPEWPALLAVRSRRVRAGWFTVLRFAAPVDAAAVLGALGRAAGRVAPVPGAAHDLGLVNPVGFRADAPEPAVDLTDLDLARGVGPALVGALRPVAGVRVAVPPWRPEVAHAVEGLRLAGVPVVTPDDRVDLTDPLAREEHSIVRRRAALDRHLARGRPHPSVSVLLATRRPEMLDFALGQLGRQRTVGPVELVLAPHGFTVSDAQVRARLPAGAAFVVRRHPASTLFGDVLHDAAGAASGELVMKWDDDDWYGPDVLADLLRARAYSGADLVGMSAEYQWLDEVGLTVRRGHPSELFVRFVAGGTLLLSRQLLGELGGFRPVRRYVDAQLIESLLAAGGTVYRTHGLGYVLRRNATGHTWDVGLDRLLDPATIAATRPGFHPSRLLEVDPAWVPGAAGRRPPAPAL